MKGCQICPAAPAIPALTCTCSTMLLAWKGIEKKDRSHASWQNKECFLELFTHSRKITFFGNALNPAVPCSKPCVDFLLWQIQDELEKQCEKKWFCQAVVPSFISERENSRKQKTILLQLLLCGKRKKNREWNERLWWNPSRTLCTEEKMLRPKTRVGRQVEDGYGLAWILKLQSLMGFFSDNSDHNLMACFGGGEGNERRRFWTVSFYLPFLLA